MSEREPSGAERRLEPFRLHELWVQHDPRGKQLQVEGANYDGLDLSGLDLREVELTKCTLNGAKLTGTDLSKAHLIECTGGFVDFTGAKLLRTTLTQSALGGSRFAGANLIQSRFAHNALMQCDFWEADLTGCRWDHNLLRSSDFRGANLAGAELRNCELDLADLTELTLDRVILWGAMVGEAYWRGAHGTLMALPVNVGTLEKPKVLEGDEALDWFRRAGADLRWMAPPPPKDQPPE